MGYVDKEHIEKLKHACIAKYPLSYINGIFAFAKEIAEMPEADVVEVKHGHWIEDGEYQVCSVCGEEHHWDEYRATYCEDCGAKMDGKGDA